VIVTLVFMIVMMAVIGSWLYTQNLTSKSWAFEGVIERGRGQIHLATPKIGLFVLLAVITALFALLVSAYYMRMSFVDWAPLPEPGILWFNTALLFISSASFHWALIASRTGRIDTVKTGMIGAGLFALAFMVGQALAWQQLAELGYFAKSNPANAFFYLITALHALHLLGGLAAWLKAGRKIWGGTVDEKVTMSLYLCATYWHFLLVIWLALFGLMLAT
jgi:cytochrome c oxidase subunit 3